MSNNNLLHGLHVAHRMLDTKTGQDLVKTALTVGGPLALATPLAPLVIVGGFGYALYAWLKK